MYGLLEDYEDLELIHPAAQAHSHFLLDTPPDGVPWEAALEALTALHGDARPSDFIQHGIELVPTELHSAIMFTYSPVTPDGKMSVTEACLAGTFYVGFANSADCDDLYRALLPARDWITNLFGDDFVLGKMIRTYETFKEPLPTREQALETWIAYENEILGPRR